jgi:DNA-binding XRE family transcriptional regulator
MARIEVSRVEELRRARGLSQRALAEAAGITRQAVGAIESGRMQPGVAIALGIARALGTTVEEVFGAGGEPPAQPERVARATIAGRAVSYPLSDEHLAIEPAESRLSTVFIGGCDLAVGLLSRHASTRSRESRFLWISMTNRAALAALERGDLHAAVVHGDLPRGSLPERAAFDPYEIATTKAGWLVRAGNPLRLRGAADLTRTRARLANRPAGAGARRLLDAQLREANVDLSRLTGYERELPGQLDAGRALAQDFADTAIGTASVAHTFGLDFIPIREERCTLLVPHSASATPEVRALLDALRSPPYRRDLEALHSYDVTRTGELLA